MILNTRLRETNPMFSLSSLFFAAALVASAQVTFTDITHQAGIKFRHNAGKAGKKLLPETMGAGCAFIDADGDGWLDIFLINSKGPSALYRNNRNGSFTDVSATSGIRAGYGMGAAVGDYDRDGRDDLYVTYLEGDRLYRNEGSFHFRDVTAASGINNANFGTSAAWLDFDKDGRLDLFVANYVQWTPKTDVWCSLDGATKSYCTPESYKGTASRLYRNLGNGKFADVGIGDATSKSLGIAVLDYDNDTWPDLFVANDTQPNKLYRNLRNGKFTEAGLSAGVAFGEDGVARGAMGVDAADYDYSGRDHLLVGNFSNQMLGLYRNEGKGLFVDEAPRSTVGRASLLSLAFGVFFFDYDNDGWLDLFAANGHIEEEINRVQPKVQFAQPPHLFRNLGKGKFQEVTTSTRLARPIVARGAAYGDIDRDGDLDILLTTNNGPAYLYRNGNSAGYNWLNLRLKNGIGAIVTVQTVMGAQRRMVRSGSSYCSASDLALHFGLAKAGDAHITIQWPSGKTQRFGSTPANQHLVVDETKGILK